MDLKTQLRAALPDVPVWVQTRDLLAFSGSEVRGGRDGFVVWSESDAMGSVVGAADVIAIADAARYCDEILAFRPGLDAVRAVLQSWACVHATVLHKPRPVSGAPKHPTKIISARDLVGWELPDALREELDDAAGDGAMTVAASEGSRGVAFAYVASETETLFDVSIDTLEEFRRRGFAKAAVTRLIIEMASRGKLPVWGSADDNPASLHLAATLGFEAIDELFVLTPPARSRFEPAT